MSFLGDLIFVYPVIPLAVFLIFFGVLKYIGKTETKKALMYAVAAFVIMALLFLIIIRDVIKNVVVV